MYLHSLVTSLWISLHCPWRSLPFPCWIQMTCTRNSKERRQFRLEISLRPKNPRGFSSAWAWCCRCRSVKRQPRSTGQIINLRVWGLIRLWFILLWGRFYNSENVLWQRYIFFFSMFQNNIISMLQVMECAHLISLNSVLLGEVALSWSARINIFCLMALHCFCWSPLRHPLPPAVPMKWANWNEWKGLCFWTQRTWS